MSHELWHEAAEFMYREAELLDERRFREWLDLFTDDTRYWMPVRHSPYERPAKMAEELSAPGESYYFNDTKETLRTRIERVYMKNAWAESPPSRTRRLISNIRVKGNGDSELEVRSNFLVYRTRLEKDQDLYVGTRKDSLRRTESRLKIAGRMIVLDQTVLAAKNISIFL